LRDSSEQVLDKERQKPLAFENETLSFSVEERNLISDHINIYTKLLVDLTNLNVVILDEDKILILLSSLPDGRYETFVLNLINMRISLRYSEMTTVLMNLELRRKKKECSISDTSAEILVARGSCPN